jgi:hypothetical protein
MKPVYKFSTYTTPEGVEKPCIILHYKASEYGAPATYSRKQPREKRGREISALLWIPNGSETNGEALTIEQRADLNRGFAFFNERNAATGNGLGFLLGAQVELRRTGELLSINLPSPRLA